MPRTAEMFEKPKRRNRVLMHVADAGLAVDDLPSVRYECRKCHYQTPWLRVSTRREARNQPCPKCNADQPNGVE
jgi:ribosomal protein L40E